MIFNLFSIITKKSFCIFLIFSSVYNLYSFVKFVLEIFSSSYFTVSILRYRKRSPYLRHVSRSLFIALICMKFKKKLEHEMNFVTYLWLYGFELLYLNYYFGQIGFSVQKPLYLSQILVCSLLFVKIFIIISRIFYFGNFCIFLFLSLFKLLFVNSN